MHQNNILFIHFHSIRIRNNNVAINFEKGLECDPAAATIQETTILKIVLTCVLVRLIVIKVIDKQT